MMHAEQHNLGRVGVEIRHQMPGDRHNVLLPDISFYTDMTAPVVERGAVPYMPDLAVEIKSPDDSCKAMNGEAAYYLANGARLGWLICPEKRLIEVLSPDDRQLLTDGDTLEGGAVLPGFALAVGDVFNV
ncbi:MAG: hypothetical protein BroJett038_27250 [Chloroflexota bacterium]|nr:MAG: hypothetical protein BroJett038_27250 [Chloroflexota bacterium]